MATPLHNTRPIQTVELVSPDLAKEWLQVNLNNRNVRRADLTKYAESMRRGEWLFTGESIKFGTNGELLDGQHRLLAIVEAGTPQMLPVWWNLDPDSKLAIDTGVRRTAADALGWRGEKNAPLMASLARLILTDGDSLRRMPSSIEIAQLVESDASIRDIVTNVPLPRLATPTVMAYAFWRLRQVDASAATEFYNALHSLSNLPPGSPILALHRYLASTTCGRSSTHRRAALSAIFVGWRAWRKGESRQVVRPSRDAQGRILMPNPRVPAAG